MRASDIALDKDLNAYTLELYPSQGTRFTPRVGLEDTLPFLLRMWNRCLGLEILRIVRAQFHHFAVVFHDDNVDSDCLYGVDLDGLPQQIEIAEALGPSSFLFDGRREQIKYLIANAGEADLLGLADGFVTQFPPVMFFYCGSRRQIPTQELVERIGQASDDRDLVRGLLDMCNVMAHPGPDVYYFALVSRDRSNLESVLRNLDTTLVYL